jgi:NAD(P)-dependent dehydrogenase (short-subunit alcohol dehydrogenase family)
VKELLSEGYGVVATCRSPATATDLQDLQKKQGKPEASGGGGSGGRLLGVVPLDVSDEQSVATALDVVKNELGLTSLDVLINNAGVATDKHPDEPVLEATADDMTRVFATNVVGPMRVTQAFYPLLLAAASTQPKIINVSSRMGSISLYQGTRHQRTITRRTSIHHTHNVGSLIPLQIS